jgi:predicted transport protein
VAYKAETNFVDVVPQAKRLRLSLNMAYHEIDDPKKLCRDMSNIGRWGNGDVEIGLSNMQELPYVMGLIRQSFDRQMGGGPDLI